MTTEKLTPLMVQYFAVKEEHPDVLIFFQVGDFYELFFEDAKIASAFLAITLTKRGKCKGEDVPLCGVPLHAGNHYIAKLVRGGFRVAICDQMTKPQPGQVVERKVTKVFTPGTLTDSVLLDDKNPSYILSFQPGEKAWGLVFTELLTSQVFATSITAEEYRALGGELTRFFPDEVVLEDIARARGFRNFFSKSGYSVSLAHVERGEDIAGPNIPKALLEQQLSKDTLRILSDNPVIEATMELLYSYLKKNNEEALSQIKEVQFYRPEDFLVLDAATQKNLEIVRNNVDGGRKNTLISVADKACSPMGSRMIKKWLLRPLVQKKAIERRHAAVEKLTTSTELLSRISDFLKQVSDLERISGRIAFGRAMLQDYLGLKSTLRIIPEIVGEIEEHGRSEFLLSVSQGMLQVPELVEFLEASLNENREYGHNIKKGFDFELDRFRELVANGQNEVSKLEQREIERTGIGSLKIRYTDLFGYSIEVTKPNLKSVPDDFILQQSLSNKSRFVTPELKKLESEILTAREKIDEVESEVYERVKAEVAQHVTALRQTAQSLAQLDAIHGFARLAYDNCYVRPKISEEHAIEIEEGRHPVVEVALDGKFIANDTHLLDDSKLWIITGPNMGGKSTYLRQVALIAILSQAGSFVPASSAKLPVLDRVFTRIGSGDNLAEGKSTFLVEMEEAAQICRQATPQSLVVLDEVGRGTSTFDGMVIAQAIIEYLAKRVKAKTLFATHYHELTQLQDRISSIANYHMESKRTDEGIIFLHRLIQGAAGGSFGLEVAKLAGLPDEVVTRAAAILKELAASKHVFLPAQTQHDAQRSIFESQLSGAEERVKILERVVSELDSVDLDSLSPRAAFDLIWRMSEKRRGM